MMEVAVHAQAVGHGGVQHLGLVGVFGSEADLQPVVDVQAPGRSRLAQLLEAAQATVGHPHAKRLAVWLVAHLPVMFPAVNQRVPWGMGWAEWAEPHKAATEDQRRAGERRKGSSEPRLPQTHTYPCLV